MAALRMAMALHLVVEEVAHLTCMWVQWLWTLGTSLTFGVLRSVLDLELLPVAPRDNLSVSL